MKSSLDNSSFLEEISSFSHSIVSLYLFALLILRRPSYLSLVLWNSAFSWVYLSLSPLLFTSLLSSAICKASSDNHFALLHFFFFGMVLVTASCKMLWTSVHIFSGTRLPGLILWIYSLHLLYNHKLFKSLLNGLVDFPTFFSLSLKFAIRSSWSEPQSAPGFAEVLFLLSV